MTRPAKRDRYRHILRAYRPTSRAAWESVQAALPAIDRRILSAIRQSQGATCDAVERLTKLTHQTVSAQVRHMVEGGLLCDSGRRDWTRSGRRAIVWHVAPYEPQGAKLF